MNGIFNIQFQRWKEKLFLFFFISYESMIRILMYFPLFLFHELSSPYIYDIDLWFFFSDVNNTHSYLIIYGKVSKPLFTQSTINKPLWTSWIQTKKKFIIRIHQHPKNIKVLKQCTQWFVINFFISIVCDFSFFLI